MFTFFFVDRVGPTLVCVQFCVYSFQYKVDVSNFMCTVLSVQFYVHSFICIVCIVCLQLYVYRVGLTLVFVQFCVYSFRCTVDMYSFMCTVVCVQFYVHSFMCTI